MHEDFAISGAKTLSASIKKLGTNELLFKEGDASDAMYVVKAGRLSIFKAKGKAEIELASVGPGAMLGEMAFFDSKPRSASVKATQETEVIILPFKALHAQFKTFPEWLKSIVKTINDHLRDANQRIKNLEQATNDTRVFPPHTITKLCSILSLVGHKYGEASPEGVVIPGGTLRKFTIQVFGEPTNRMQKLTEQLTGLGYMKIEDLGEGKQRMTMLKLEQLSDFVEFYNDYLFKDEAKRVTVEEAELKTLRALIYFGNQVPADDKGKVKVSLNNMQNESMKALGHLVTTNDVNGLMTKGLIGEKESQKGELFSTFSVADLSRLLPFWELIYTLEKVQR
jgi:CRP/FNR family transcriptional regulator, cyclic AMP receptor protein